MDEDNLSSASFVSSISASSIHQPRPPGGPKPSSQGFRAKRTEKIIRSPYLATSTPYLNNKKHHVVLNGNAFSLQEEFNNTTNHHAMKSIAKDRWARAVKATGGPSVGWGNAKYMPHPSASVFLQSLMKAPSFSAVVASKKRKRTQSASTGMKKRVGLSSMVGVDGKDAISLRDELVEVKKSLNEVTREKELTQARYAKLEQALERKDKEIEDLLASGHITSRDATRSLTNSTATKKQGKQSTSSAAPGAGSVAASGSGAVIASLRGKIHSLERALREKESALAAIKREVNTTRLKEMEIQCEIYIGEINRLKQLLDSHTNPPTCMSDSPCSQREAQVKFKALNKATVKLASQLEKKEAENNRLKQQLEKFRCESVAGGETITHNEHGVRGSIADRYVDHKRSELLAAIVDLELRLQEKEGALESVCKEMEGEKSHYERRIGELSGSHSDANSKIKLLEDKLSEVEVSREKLRNIIRKLKDDRTHYRTVADNTQSELLEIQKKMEKEGMGKKDIIQELEALREKHQNEVIAREHARKLSKRRSQLVITPEKERKESAAVAIQQQWRKRQAIQRQSKFHEATEQGILDIQSTLRGHLTRKKVLSSQLPHSPTKPQNTSDLEDAFDIDVSDSDSSETSLAVERIQAALRGHASRQMALQDLQRINGRTDNVSTGSNVYLHSGMDSTSVTELWKGVHDGFRLSPENLDVQPVNSNPLDSAHHSYSREVKKKRREANSQKILIGQGRSPCLLRDSSDSSDDDSPVIQGEADTESALLPAPLPQPEISYGSNSESNGYQVNPETALLADELT